MVVEVFGKGWARKCIGQARVKLPSNMYFLKRKIVSDKNKRAKPRFSPLEFLAVRTLF